MLLQVAITFVLAVLYWVTILGLASAHPHYVVVTPNETSSAYQSSVSTYELQELGLVSFVFAVAMLLPVLLSVIATIRLPFSMVVTPVDIVVITWGLAILEGVTSPSSIESGGSFTYLLISSVFLVFTNSIAYRLIGLEGAGATLQKRVYKTSKPVEEVVALLSSDEIRQTLSLVKDDEINGVTIFRERFAPEFRRVVAVSRQASGVTGCYLSIIAFKRERWSLMGIEERRFEGICGEVVFNLKELALEAVPSGVVPNEALDFALRPTRGYRGWIERLEKGSSQNFVLMFFLLGLDAILWYVLHFSDVDAFFIAVTIIVTQVGQITYRRRQS